MIERCHMPGHPKYGDYGQRGISVCTKWRESFKTFVKDVGRRPTGKHVMDRINNDGNYEPLNFRWATPRQSIRNRRPRSPKIGTREQIVQALMMRITNPELTQMEILDKVGLPKTMRGNIFSPSSRSYKSERVMAKQLAKAAKTQDTKSTAPQVPPELLLTASHLNPSYVN